MSRFHLQALASKLTLAFLLVGVIGILLFGFLVAQRTRTEFDRFLSSRDQAVILNALGDYYATHGSWAQVEQMLVRDPALAFYSRNLILTDAEHKVVLGRQLFADGQALPEHELEESTPIAINGRTIGFVHFLTGSRQSDDGNGPVSAEATFWQRVGWAAATSAGLAALIALVLGGVLARTLTQPIRELTAATQALARGNLDQRVTVRSNDEIGELATSFNQMSADLVRASQLRKQMTADLAHDLRTPLTILRGYMEGLKEGRLPGTTVLYSIMHDEVVHLQRLVEDLRMLSLADAGELPLNRRTVDPMALLERTVLAYIGQAEQQGIDLRVIPPSETDEGLPSISVDTDRMTQVLNNLVSNALRYTTQGEIILSAQTTPRQVLLKVSDTGAGIAPEHLSFVFDRFYRADPSRQRIDDNSSGLGLAIAKAIVEAHDGSLTVESSPGHGTTFTIALARVHSQ